MRVLPHRLSQALAKRLNGLMPPGFRLTADHEWLELFIEGDFDGTLSAPQRIEEETADLGAQLEIAVYEVLDGLQDAVAEHLRAPWPSRDGRNMGLPEVRLTAESIHLWYGDAEREPVLAIPEIPLAEIGAKRS
jgi:hypothetical protein